MECSFLVDHGDSPEQVAKKAGKRIAKMLRQTGHTAHDHSED